MPDQCTNQWDTCDDCASELFEDCGYAAEMPEHLAPYFDMRAWARELAHDYTTHPAPGGGVLRSL